MPRLKSGVSVKAVWTLDAPSGERFHNSINREGEFIDVFYKHVIQKELNSSVGILAYYNAFSPPLLMCTQSLVLHLDGLRTGIALQ